MLAKQGNVLRKFTSWFHIDYKRNSSSLSINRLIFLLAYGLAEVARDTCKREDSLEMLFQKVKNATNQKQPQGGSPNELYDFSGRDFFNYGQWAARKLNCRKGETRQL